MNRRELLGILPAAITLPTLPTAMPSTEKWAVAIKTGRMFKNRSPLRWFVSGDLSGHRHHLSYTLEKANQNLTVEQATKILGFYNINKPSQVEATKDYVYFVSSDAVAVRLENGLPVPGAAEILQKLAGFKTHIAREQNGIGRGQTAKLWKEFKAEIMGE